MNVEMGKDCDIATKTQTILRNSKNFSSSEGLISLPMAKRITFDVSKTSRTPVSELPYPRNIATEAKWISIFKAVTSKVAVKILDLIFKNFFRTKT